MTTGTGEVGLVGFQATGTGIILEDAFLPNHGGFCGTGFGNISLPGDPNLSAPNLSASSAFGGILVSWTYPTLNPNAVAHVLLYRGTENNFNTASLLRTVTGDSHFDRAFTEADIVYYYWIQVVSVQGTVGTVIGPASAVMQAPMQEIIDGLVNKVTSSTLDTALRGEINSILSNRAILDVEISERLAGEVLLAQSIFDTVADLNTIDTLVTTETSQRILADAAQVNQISVILAQNGANSASIIETNEAWADGVSAVAGTVNTLSATVGDNTTALEITAEVVSGEGGLTSQYMVKIEDGSGLIAGYGLYNDGVATQFAIRADTFSVGSATYADVVPFIIDTVDGVPTIALNAATLIPDASIGNASIGNTIQSTGYSASTAGWQLKKDFGLTLRGAGGAIQMQVLTGGGTEFGSDISNSAQTYAAITGTKPPENAAANAPSIGAKSNYVTFAEANTGEIYIHGFNAEGQAANIAGYISYNGEQISIQGNILTGTANSTGFLMYDPDPADLTGYTRPYLVNSVGYNKVFAKKEGQQWYYDNNNSWVPFTPSATALVFGDAITAATDVVDSANAWGYGRSPASIVDPNADVTDYDSELISNAKLNIPPNALINPTAIHGTNYWEGSFWTTAMGPYGEGGFFYLSTGATATSEVMYQDLIPCAAGTNWTLSAELYSSGNTTGHFAVDVIFRDANNNTTAEGPQVTVYADQSWTRMSGNFNNVAPAGTTQMTVRIFRANADGFSGVRRIKLERGTNTGTAFVGASSGATVGATWSTNVTGQPSDTELSASTGMLETFQYDSISELPWTGLSNGAGELELTIAAGGEVGGKVLQIGNNSGNDEAWLVFNKSIPYDPSKIYRIAFRVKRLSGTGVLYLGVSGRNATDTNWVNKNGSASYSVQHYIAASGATPGTEWVTYVGFFSGANTTGTGSSINSYDNPATLHEDAKYFRPHFIVNYNDAPGQVQVDGVVVEVLSANPDATVGAEWATGIQNRPAESNLLNTQQTFNAITGDKPHIDADVTDYDSALINNGKLDINPNLLPNPTGLLGDEFWALGAWSFAKSSFGLGTYFQPHELTGGTHVANSDLIPCAVGSSYTLSADLWAQGVTSGALVVDLNFVDGSGATLLDGPEVSQNAANATFSATRMVSNARNVAPAGTVYMRVRVFSQFLTATVAGVRRIKVERGSEATAFVGESTGATFGADSSNLAVGVGTNLVPNAAFTEGLQDISFFESGTFNTGLDLSPTWTLENGHTLYIQQDNANAAEYCNTYFGRYNPNQAVTAGERLEASAYVGSHRCTTNIGIMWLNAAGSSLGNTPLLGSVVASEALGGSQISGYKRIGGFYTVPNLSGLAYAMVFLQKQGTNAGEADSYMFATRPFMARAFPNQTELSEWNPGTSKTNWENIPDRPDASALLNNLQTFGDIQGDKPHIDAGPNARIDSNLLQVFAPLGAAYNENSAVKTGAIVVFLPQLWTNTMLMFDIANFGYGFGAESKSFVATVGGYTSSSQGNWTRASAKIQGYIGGNNRIRFGTNGTKAVVVIGDDDSTWSYPKISIRNFQAGHYNYTVAEWEDNWDIDIVSDLSSYTFVGASNDFADALLDAQAAKSSIVVEGEASYRYYGYGYNNGAATTSLGGLRDNDGVDLGGFGGQPRSYILHVYDRDSETWDSHTSYDVHGTSAAATQLATAINSHAPDKILVVTGQHAPAQNRLLGGLPAALYNIGGSRTVFEREDWSGNYPTYFLAGVPGIGEGNGIEHFSKAQGLLDVTFYIKKGSLVGTNYTPDFTPGAEVNVGPNLIANAELGGPKTPASSTTTQVVAGWTHSISNVSESYVKNATVGEIPPWGKLNQRIFYTAITATAGGATGRWTTAATIPIDITKNYNLSGWFRSVSGDSRVFFRLQCVTASGSSAANQYLSTLSNTAIASTWTRYDKAFGPQGEENFSSDTVAALVQVYVGYAQISETQGAGFVLNEGLTPQKIDATEKFALSYLSNVDYSSNFISNKPTTLQEIDATAAAQLDNKTVTYYQNDPPSSPDGGDLWVDTNNSNKLYRRNDGNTVWNLIQDAAAAQQTADAAQVAVNTKVTTFYENSAPSGSTGDLWYDTNDPQRRLYRYNGTTWQIIGDQTAYNTAAYVDGQGDFATLDAINLDNISTYIEGAAIGTAQIGNLAVNNSKIGNLAVNNSKIDNLAVSTLKIANNAVTIPVGYSNSNTQVLTIGTWNTIAFVTLSPQNAKTFLSCSLSYDQTGGYLGAGAGIRIVRGSTVIFQESHFRPSFTSNMPTLLTLSAVDSNAPVGTTTYSVQVYPGANFQVSILSSYLYGTAFLK